MNLFCRSTGHQLLKLTGRGKRVSKFRNSKTQLVKKESMSSKKKKVYGGKQWTYLWNHTIFFSYRAMVFKCTEHTPNRLVFIYKPSVGINGNPHC